MLKPSSAKSSEALRATIEHAERAPYYAEAWKDVARKGSGVELLLRLPLLEKETAARAQERLIVPGIRPHRESFEAGIVSSATTRQGRPLRILGSPDEWAPPPPRAPTNTARAARTLRLYSPRHGVPTPESRRVFLPATLHPNTVDVLDDLLAQKGPAAFSYLVGPLSAIKWLSVALVERGRPPASYGLLGVGTTGHTLTTHARRWLEPLWKAPFFDNYSLSELRGHAHPCTTCGYAHWHGAPTHFELVDPLRGAPTRDDVGELVATTLVPHGLRMPLIRYRTGDIVEAGARCSRHGTRGIRFRGRLSQSLLVASSSGTQYHLLSRDLQEATEALADVALEPHPAEVLGRVPASDIGVPRAKIDLEREVVRVELRYDPSRYAKRARAVREALIEALKGADPKRELPAIELSGPGTVDIRRESLKLV